MRRYRDGGWVHVIGVELDDVEDPPRAWVEPDEFVEWITDHATDEQILALRERIMGS